MKAKFIYEALTDIFRPKQWDEIKTNIESKGEPEFDYWMNFVLEFDKLFDGKLQGSVMDWEFNEEKQYRVIVLETVIGPFKFLVDWHVSKKIPNMAVDIGTSSRQFFEPIVIPDNPKELAVEVLEKIREQNQAKPRPAHSFKRRNE